MKGFNYSKFHFFDKSGTEIILKKTGDIRIVLVNESYPEFSSEYILVLSNDNVEDFTLLKTKSGSRYQNSNLKADIYFPNEEKRTVSIPTDFYEIVEYTSSKGIELYPELNCDKLYENKDSFLSLIGIDSQNIKFPSMTFDGTLTFNKISTELVETQSIYVLVETDDEYKNKYGIHGLVDVKEYAEKNIDASTYINNYDLFFFIDCRNQKDFRFFTVDGDEVVWSDRHTMDFNGDRYVGGNNGFRVDIGFSGELEGVYEQKMYVCVLDKSTNNVIPIGTLNMTAETEGEDERYRTFFTNFGLPSIDEIEPAFKDFNKDDDYPDHITRNKHSKKLFLSYSEIFPYAGTYKALANAINLLGYDDIFFKEWYKDIGNSTVNDGGYISFNLSFKSNNVLNTINNKPIEERIQLKKMNWISLMYNINKEIEDVEDKWGFPGVEDNINYYNTGNIVKLISLKKWLDKYIVGVNCRIIDVGGEGVVFERYNLAKYGQYQQVFDYTNEKTISLKVNHVSETIIDGSANISIDLNTSNMFDTFEDLSDKKFIDFCDGYFNDENIFRNNNLNSIDDNPSYVYFGKTFELNNNMDSFELRANGKIDSFIFNNDEFIYERHPQLILDNKKIIYNPLELLTKPKNSAFTNLPVIKINRARIKRYKNNLETYGELAYDASIYPYKNKIKISAYDFETGNSYEYLSNDDIILVPPISSKEGNYIIIKPRFSKNQDRNSRDLNGPFKIQGESSQSVDSVIFDNRTYGLRFSSDTLSGEPVFMIAGYESPQIYLDGKSDHFPLTNASPDAPEPYEYCIEILNGSMIFNDPTNNRKVSIIFEFDGKNKNVYVNTLQYENHFTLYEYKTSDTDTTNRFMNEIKYDYFVNGYKTNPDDNIIFNKTKLINVLNAGTYNVESVIYDECNNMFYSKTNENINVITHDIDASTFTLDSSTRTSYNVPGSHITDDEKNMIERIHDRENGMCILEYVPKFNIISKNGINFQFSGTNTSDSSYIDNGSVLYRTENDASFVHISNTTERFVYIGSYKLDSKTVLSFIRRSFKSKTTGQILVDEHDDIMSPQPTINDELNCDYEQSIDLSQNGSYTDAIITIYDNSYDFPLFSYPGICIPVKDYNSSYELDEYRVILDENVVSDGELNEFINYLKKPSTSTYILPAWSLSCHILDSSNPDIVIPNQYPFTKKLIANDNCKLLFKFNTDYFGQSTYQIKEYNENNIKLDSSLNKRYSLVGSETNLELFVSPEAREYSEFIIPVSNNNTNLKNGEFTIENNNINRELSYYFDTTYSASFRNFDIRKGMDLWNDKNMSLFNDSYSYNCPVSTTVKSIMIIPILPLNDLENNKYIIKWQIYKQHVDPRRDLILECFNNVLCVDLDPGTYNVNLTVYDKHGNKFVKSLDGAITIE